VEASAGEDGKAVRKSDELEGEHVLVFVHEIDCWDLFLDDIP
jgi:hypothetical protein